MYKCLTLTFYKRKIGFPSPEPVRASPSTQAQNTNFFSVRIFVSLSGSLAFDICVYLSLISKLKVLGLNPLKTIALVLVS